MPESSSVDPAALGFATRQVHAGLRAEAGPNPRATPIYLSAGFVFDGIDQAEARFTGAEEGFSYTRVSNPTHAALERRLADLEGGSGALVLGTGQAAVSTALLALAASGDHLVVASGIYEGTRELVRDNFARLGITGTFVHDAADLGEWERAIQPNTRALFVESIANPRNEIADLRALAEVAHRHGIPLVVDNTLATPYLLRPIEHGADIVVHSASKGLSGHGTVLGGVIVDSGWFDWSLEPERFPHLAVHTGADGRTYAERFGTGAFLEYARSLAMRLGPSASPLNAFLILQGVETLSLRVQRQADSAIAIARWLEQHPAVASVDYAGLPANRHHALAKRYLPRGQGSVFAFTLHGGRAAASAVVDRLELFTHMAHLGDVRSLVLHPASTLSAGRSEEERERAGISQGLLRLSIGVEEPDDLIRDLERAFASIDAAVPSRVGEEVRG